MNERVLSDESDCKLKTQIQTQYLVTYLSCRGNRVNFISGYTKVKYLQDYWGFATEYKAVGLRYRRGERY